MYLGFEKSQRSVTHGSLCYIFLLTYLLTESSYWNETSNCNIHSRKAR